MQRFGESRKSISELEAVGMDTLHIDVIDGSFSPSMPLGIETIKRMRKSQRWPLMCISCQMIMNFIGEMLKVGVEGITFHQETKLTY